MTTPEVGTTLVRASDLAPAPVVDYAQELRGAKILMASGLVPAGVKSPEAALFIILTGRDLGLSPVQSLRSIHIISGKIEVAADQQLGLFHRAGGKSQWVKLTNTEAVLRLSASWLLVPHEESFTMEDAKRAGLDKPARSGEPSMFVKFPRPMLRSRAITAGLKSIGFDPTSGIYAPGEVGGDAVVVGEIVEAPVEPAQPEPPEPMEADEDDPGEIAALRELEEVIPHLTVDQQIWTKEALGEGANPVKILAGLKERLAAKVAPKGRVPA